MKSKVLEKKFGEKLKVLRAAAKLSQRELASKVGIKQQSLQALEVGKTEPLFGTAVRLAKALGVDIHELFGDES